MRRKRWIVQGLLCALTACFMGCDSGGGDSEPADIGDNNAGVVIALGDSITNGVCEPAGAPYPARVASATGKSVINAGTCGERASEGAARVGGLLARHKPGALLVLYGANDAILGTDPGDTIAGIRAIIRAGKANQTQVFVGTLMPMFDEHAPFQPHVEALNPLIRQAVSEEGGRLVNLAGEFGMRRELLQADGLHPTDDGTRIIAAAFSERL